MVTADPDPWQPAIAWAILGGPFLLSHEPPLSSREYRRPPGSAGEDVRVVGASIAVFSRSTLPGCRGATDSPFKAIHHHAIFCVQGPKESDKMSHQGGQGYLACKHDRRTRACKANILPLACRSLRSLRVAASARLSRTPHATTTQKVVAPTCAGTCGHQSDCNSPAPVFVRSPVTHERSFLSLIMIAPAACLDSLPLSPLTGADYGSCESGPLCLGHPRTHPSSPCSPGHDLSDGGQSWRYGLTARRCPIWFLATEIGQPRHHLLLVIFAH